MARGDRKPAADDAAGDDGERGGGDVAPAEEAAASWGLDVPEGWLLWEPATGAPAELATAATSTPRAARSLARRIAVVEKEVALVPGDVRQVGLRVPEAASGRVSASMRMTHWLRPMVDGKALNARRHLDDLEALEPEPGRTFQHRESSIVKVPAGQVVLRNEISRLKYRASTTVELVTTIFPRGTSSIFEITVTSKYMELQPDLMAELSLMAHSFHT